MFVLFYYLFLHVKMPNYKQETKGPSDDGTITNLNPHIHEIHTDFLHHFGLGTTTHNLHEMFGDIKFVCMGGTKLYMEWFANYIMAEIQYKIPTGTALCDISHHSERYAMYKVGPVLCVSHGMGMSSISIVLNEIIKLVYYAKIKDPIMFKVGMSGGFGLDRGTVVITKHVVDSMMNSSYQVPILGKLVLRPAKLDLNLVQELHDLASYLASHPADSYSTIAGTTMCTSDFYEEQARIDGAFCHFDKREKAEYISYLYRQGVANIEMHGIPFAAITHHAGIQAAIVCVTTTDKLTDIEISPEEKLEKKWRERPAKLITSYIKRYLLNNGLISL